MTMCSLNPDGGAERATSGTIRRGVRQPAFARDLDGDGLMDSAPTTKPPAPGLSETVEERFRRLEATWNAETGYLSSYTDIVEHPAFREIIGLGKAVVPLMLRDLQERPRLWVWALPEITGADPVPPGEGGNIARMSGTSPG
jgi:hypothetical protein